MQGQGQAAAGAGGGGGGESDLLTRDAMAALSGGCVGVGFFWGVVIS